MDLATAAVALVGLAIALGGYPIVGLPLYAGSIVGFAWALATGKQVRLVLPFNHEFLVIVLVTTLIVGGAVELAYSSVGLPRPSPITVGVAGVAGFWTVCVSLVEGEVRYRYGLSLDSFDCQRRAESPLSFWFILATLGVMTAAALGVLFALAAGWVSLTWR